MFGEDPDSHSPYLYTQADGAIVGKVAAYWGKTGAGKLHG